jgi:hypothetical protein
MGSYDMDDPMAAKQRRRTATHRGKIMTSVELPPKLHERVRIYAVRTRTSLRAVIEEALLDLLRRKE